MNTPERIFLGWNAPAIKLVAERLLAGLTDPQTAAQYRRATVVVPTAESGRRLREYMAEQAGKPLLMPTMTLAGHLIPTDGAQVASELETLAAWLKVMGDSVKDKQPLSWQLKVVTQMQRVRTQLEQEARSPEWDDASAREFVREHLQEPDENWNNTIHYEQERWQALRSAFNGVDEQLRLWKRIPAEQVRADELETPRPRGLLIIACVPELSPLNRLYLQRLTDTKNASVEIWINAPASEAPRFDTFGQPLPIIAVGPRAGQGWAECPIEIPREIQPHEFASAARDTDLIHSTGTPSAYGLKVRELAGGLHSDEVVLASCDESLSPMLVSAFHPEWQINLPEGRSLLATDAGRLPLQLRDACLATEGKENSGNMSMENFLTLLKNHALQSILAPAGSRCSFNRFLTELCFEHLPGSKEHLCHLILRKIEESTVPGQPRRWKRPQLADFLLYTQTVIELLHDCCHEKQLPLRLKELAAAIRRHLDTPEMNRAGQLLAEILHQTADLVSDREIACPPQVALMLMAHQAEKQAGGVLEGAGERGRTINLRGWKELCFALEPQMIIAGMHDGCVPERMPTDACLPQAYRAFLGMTNDTTRSARDSFLLTALLHSRPVGAIHFVLAACSTDGTPIAPSTLLLRCNSPAATAERVSWLFADAPAPHRHADYEQVPFIEAERSILPGLGMEPASFIAPGIPNPYADPATTFSPSSIKDFLTCPLRFWLKKLLKVDPGDALEDNKSEPDAAEYGTLLHAILQDITTRFAKAEAGAETNTLASEIARYAEECTASHIAEQYAHESSTLTVPIRILQRNLEKTVREFARQHAQDLCDGWEVIMCEEQLTLELPLANGEQPLRFDMRVDRVDRHRYDRSRMRVIDYKTNAADPRKTHWEKLSETAAGLYTHYMPDTLVLRNKKGELLRWSSVQLPLYAEALRHQFNLTNLPETGFFNMPRNKPGEVKFNLLSGLEQQSTFEPELHARAMACVRTVASLMRSGLCLYSAESLGRSMSYDSFGSLSLHNDPDPRVMCSLPPLPEPDADN